MMIFLLLEQVQVQTECAEVQVYVQEITDRTVPCYCIMILARRGHQTALVQYM